MKKIFLFTMLLLMACSCSKSDSSSIEGMWGLTHGERYRMINGSKTDIGVVNCDPSHPATVNDLKFSIFKSSEDTYVFTYFYWDPQRNRWNTNPETQTFVRNGNAFMYSGGGEDFYYNILSLTSDSLVMEYMNPEQDISGISDKVDIGYQYAKYSFVRLRE